MARTPSAIRLIDSICAKLTTCFPQANTTTCQSQLENVTGMTTELGSTASAYPTVLDLHTAELSGAVILNQTNYSTCTGVIGALSCADTLVTQSYSSSSPTNFSRAYLVLRSSSSCTQIY